MSSSKWSTDRIIGLSAMLISLLTLIIFIYQTNLMRKQSRLSVMPRISFQDNFVHQDSSIIVSSLIINKGIGPAIIESIQIIDKEKKYPFDFGEFILAVYPDIEQYGALLQSMSMDKGSTLLPGEQSSIYKFSVHQDQMENVKAYLGMAEDDRASFHFEIIYSSIYGDQWKVISNQEGHPIPQ